MGFLTGYVSPGLNHIILVSTALHYVLIPGRAISILEATSVIPRTLVEFIVGIHLTCQSLI